MTRWISPEGFTVDAVTLTGTGRHEDGDWLHVRFPNGVLLARVRRFDGDVAWLAEHGLGELLGAGE